MNTEKRIEHPAFGMIGISNVSGTSVLAGSAVRHQHFVSLTVSAAVKYQDEYTESFHATDRICEINLSHSQLAEMLFSANHGSGVPCTLRWVRGDTHIRPEPPFESPLKRGTDDLRSLLNQTLGRAKELAKEAEHLIETGVPRKADREKLAFLAMKIAQDIESNLPYAGECVDEKMEKTIAHAKSEVESFVNMKFMSLGIDAAHQKPQLLISENMKGQP